MKKRPYIFIGGTSEPGGLHVHTATVAVAAAATGHPVTVLCTSIDYYSALLAKTPVRVECAPAPQEGEHPIRYWRRVLAQHRHAACVLTRGQLGECRIHDLTGLRLSGRRLYIIDHRNYAPHEMPDCDPRNHGRMMRWCVRRLIGVSDEISESARTLFGFPASRIATCLNWVDPAYRHADEARKRDAKIALGFAPDTQILGYHGRLAPEKRGDALIEAYATLPPELRNDWRLVFVGDGWKRAKWEALAVERGIADRMSFTGWLPDPSAAVAALDCAVLPSLAEGFPLGLLEAMATGCACLAHPMSSSQRLIQNGVNGWLADLSSQDTFRAALQNLMTSTASERQRAGHAAAKHVASHYSQQRRLPDVLRALDVQPDPDAVAAPPRNLVFIRS